MSEKFTVKFQRFIAWIAWFLRIKQVNVQDNYDRTASRHSWAVKHQKLGKSSSGTQTVYHRRHSKNHSKPLSE